MLLRLALSEQTPKATSTHLWVPGKYSLLLLLQTIWYAVAFAAESLSIEVGCSLAVRFHENQVDYFSIGSDAGPSVVTEMDAVRAGEARGQVCLLEAPAPRASRALMLMMMAMMVLVVLMM